MNITEKIKSGIKKLYDDIPSYESAWYALKRVEEMISDLEKEKNGFKILESHTVRSKVTDPLKQIWFPQGAVRPYIVVDKPEWNHLVNLHYDGSGVNISYPDRESILEEFDIIDDEENKEPNI